MTPHRSTWINGLIFYSRTVPLYHYPADEPIPDHVREILEAKPDVEVVCVDDLSKNILIIREGRI